jgi:hypothetical protein
MSTDSSPPRSVPIGAILLLAIAGFLYLGLIYNIAAQGGIGPEDSLGQAILCLFLTILLWLVLAILLLVGGVMGEMPGPAPIVAAVLTPVSGIAAFTAIDLYSRHGEWAITVIALLPLLIALYAMWARLPALHAMFPPRTTSLAIWSAILLLSMASFVFASL